jgi:hypothetical protein
MSRIAMVAYKESYALFYLSSYITAFRLPNGKLVTLIRFRSVMQFHSPFGDSLITTIRKLETSYNGHSYRKFLATGERHCAVSNKKPINRSTPIMISS